MLHHALSYIQRGFAVVPLLEGTKLPAKKDIYTDPINTDEKAKKFWSGSNKNCGIGIFLGGSGLVCIDLDCNHGATEEDLKKFPRTVTVKTRNGYHLYYKAPKGPIKNKVLIPPLPGKATSQAVAYLRTGNHYVVAPPTVVWIDKELEVPEWEYKWHGDPGGTLNFYELKNAAPCPPEWVSVDEELEASERGRVYGPNMRHEMFTKTAVAMAAKGKTYDQIVESLHERNRHHCQPPKTEAEGLSGEIANIAAWATAKVPVGEGAKSQAVLARPDAIGPEVVSERVDSEAPIQDGNLALEDQCFPHQVTDKNGKIRRLGTRENIEHLLKLRGVSVRYNVISKKEEITIPNELYTPDNRANASIADITSWCVLCGISTSNLVGYVTKIADKNSYNPVALWIESQAWDGKSRLQEFYDTIHSSDKKLKEKLMRPWLISAVAALYEQNGVSAHGVLVLQGPQYIGKTQWFKRLVPAELEATADGMMLKPDDKDSVFQVISKWLVELGELDATFSRSDISQLKAFITKNQDVLRRPYSAKESEYARRTVFFASVNDVSFLSDPTGNRRFWTIACDKIDYDHKVDMQQLWAEVKTLYAKGEKWTLDSEHMQQLNEHNRKFQTQSAVEEKIGAMDWEGGKEWRTASDVLDEIGYKNPGMMDCKNAARILRQLSTLEPKRGNQGMLFHCPVNKFEMPSNASNQYRNRGFV